MYKPGSKFGFRRANPYIIKGSCGDSARLE